MATKDAQSLGSPAPIEQAKAPAADRAIPLCVDLDGTLVKTDCLWETLVQAFFRNPRRLAAVLAGAWRGLPWFKREMSKAATFSAESLPYNADVIALITREKAAGRKVVLVSASDQNMADNVAAHVKLFDEVIGSDGVTNLKGAAKAALLVKKFGRGGFDYAGDSTVDIPVWEAARHAYAVNPSRAAMAWAARRRPATTMGPARGMWRPLARALRPQHWVKNTLVFLPLLTAHAWPEGQAWLRTASFFMALCFGASAVYLINDLADIESDRRRKDKWRRPVASGALLISEAVVAIPLCLGLAVFFCSVAGWEALELLGGYLAAAIACSFYLKRAPIPGVLLLSGLYVFPIFAGAILAPVALSPWLVAFAMFLSLILAAAKRCVKVQNDRRP